MFPSLRPTGDILLLPDNSDENSRRWMALCYRHDSEFVLHEIFFRLQVCMLSRLKVDRSISLLPAD